MSNGVGAMPYGSGPFGAGGEFDIEFLSCFMRSTIEIWILVDGVSNAPCWDQNSELLASNWTIIPRESSSFGRKIQHVEQIVTRDDALRAGVVDLYDEGLVPALRVFTDGPLTPGDVYDLTYDGFNTETCPVVGVLVGKEGIASNIDQGTVEDYKNPQFNQDKLPLGSLGTYNFTDSGDVAIDNGQSSLKKRIVRRITTEVSGFYHLPNYGTDTENKSTTTADRVRRVRDRVQNGIRKEPDVVRADTRVYRVSSEPGMLVIQAKVKPVFGDEFSVSEEVKLNG